MAYFTDEYNEFFRELALNNYREWFHENKKRYESRVKKPFYRFLEDLIAEVKKDDPELELEPKNAVFRINRDIRFSKDKSPYKLHMGGVIARGGRKAMERPGIYVQFGGGDVMIAGGSYMPDKDNLAKIRAAIVKDPQRFNRIIEDKEFKRVCGGMSEGKMNKILPKPIKKYKDELPVLLNKQYFYHRNYEDPGIILREDLIDFVMNHYRAAKDFSDFLTEAMYS